jgi:hypothetical protein
VSLQSLINALVNLDAAGNLNVIPGLGVAQPYFAGMTVGQGSVTMTGSLVALPSTPCKAMMVLPAAVSYVFNYGGLTNLWTVATTAVPVWVPCTNTNLFSVNGASGPCPFLYFT